MTPGTQLGSYEILSPLGKGGMGEVWRARDQKLGREVAIKTLPEEFAQDEERLARFEREAKLLASLNHPNIAAIYGLEEDNGTRFLVLELVEGDTLAVRLKRGAIPVEESLTLALQIAEALEAAHEKGVIHRDLKPLNIKVTPDGKIKVLDFGLAKAFMGDGADVNLSQSPTLSMQATQQGVILGTAAYMSPEQARGVTVDKRADIWAFGCVLYEMLTGRQVFKGELMSDVMASVLKSDPDYKGLPPTIHPKLRDVLRRCLEKEPKDRWHDVADVRLELEQVLADPSGTLVQPIGDHSPRPILPWIAALILSVAVTGSAVWVLKPTPTVDPRVAMRFSHLLGNEGFTRTGRPLVAVSRDGTRVAYVADLQLYLRNLNESEARLIAGTDEDPSTPFFSPDGESIGFWAGIDGELKRIPVAGGRSVMLTPAAIPFGVTWGTDGAIVYGSEEGVWRVSENGGVPDLIVTAAEGEQVHGPQMLPGGTHILYTVTLATGETRWDEAQIVAESLESHERTVLVTGGSDARYVSTGHLVYALESDLMALRFDPDTLTTTAGHVVIVADVRRAEGMGTTTASANYEVSDNGTLVYVPGLGGSPRELVHVDEQGASTRLTDETRNYQRPKVSPDGTRIAVTINSPIGGTQIWILILETGEMHQFTFEGTNTIASWTPNSERLIFQSTLNGPPGLFIQDATGIGNSPEPLLQSEDVPWLGNVSPEGILAYYKITGGRERDIWTLSLEERTETEFLVTPANERNPVFSPDGRWIAYMSDDLGQDEVFVRPYPPTGGSPFRISDYGGEQPRWSGDGRVLYFIDPAGQVMMASAIEADPVFSRGQPRDLFSGLGRFRREANNGGYDIHPDGGFVMTTLVDTSLDSSPGVSARINIVLNWFEELKERVPVP